MTPKRSPDNLTMKERRMLDNYTDKNSPTYGNGSKSCQEAYGYKPKTAEAEASTILSKPRVRAEFVRRLEKEGVTTKFLSKRLKENLLAHQPYFNVPKKVVEERPDWTNRNKALDLAGKFMDLYPESKVSVQMDLAALVAGMYAKPE